MSGSVLTMLDIRPLQACRGCISSYSTFDAQQNGRGLSSHHAHPPAVFLVRHFPLSILHYPILY